MPQDYTCPNLTGAYRIRRVEVTPDAGVVVTFPIVCSSVGWRNDGPGDCRIVHDTSNYDTLQKGSSGLINAPLPTVVSMLNPKPLPSRFAQGTALFRLELISGESAVVTFHFVN